MTLESNQLTLILLVEDDFEHAELVRRTLAAYKERLRLTVAGSLAEACIAQANPNLIVADLCLPDGLGIELLSILREGRTIPLVVMTGQRDEAASVEAMKAGALDYLGKSEDVVSTMPQIAERCLREWENISGRQVAERGQMESEKRFRLLVKRKLNLNRTPGESRFFRNQLNKNEKALPSHFFFTGLILG